MQRAWNQVPDLRLIFAQALPADAAVQGLVREDRVVDAVANAAAIDCVVDLRNCQATSLTDATSTMAATWLAKRRRMATRGRGKRARPRECCVDLHEDKNLKLAIQKGAVALFLTELRR